MYTIKRAAELTGISVATLRAWERRYGVVRPQRTDSGYRLYDADAVRALTIMNSLVQDGWTPKLAAQETERRLGEEGEGVAPDGGPRPEPRGEPTPPPVADSEGVVRAAARLDAAGLSDLLDEGFARGSFETTVDGWLMPALHAVGDAWSEGRVSVAGEHMVSYAVQRRLAAAYEAAGRSSEGPKVVVGLPPGARHELGLLAFATAARRVGLSTVYVGADLPADEWSAAVTAQHAVAVVLAVPCAEDLDALRTVVQDLHATHPGLLVAVGGRLQDEAPQECLRLGHDLGGAALLLAEALAARGRGSGR